MKQVLVLTLGLLFTGLLTAQEKIEAVKSETESFSARSGVLLKKEFIDVGKLSGMEVSVFKVSDLSKSVSKSALRLSYESGGTYSSTKIAHLDSEELDGLEITINNMINNILITEVSTYTEIVFRSNTGFECGVYRGPKDSSWSPYLKLEKYDSKSTVYLKSSDLSKFLDLIKLAKTKM